MDTSDIPAGPPAPNRRAARKTRTRAAILAAGAQVFAERGYGSASLEEIARVADVAIGSVYAHFSGKEALFFDVLADHIDDSLHNATSLLHGLPDATPAIGRQLGETADSPIGPLLDAEAWLYAARHDGDLSARLREHYDQLHAKAALLVGQYRVPDSDLPFTDPELAVVVVALIEGLLRRRRLAPDDVPDDLFARVLLVLGGPAPGRNGTTGPDADQPGR